VIHIPFERVNSAHIHMLEASLNVAPLYERISLEEIIKNLRERKSILFEVPSGLIVAEVREGGGERRLAIPAFYSTNFGAHARGIIAGMVRLAKDWNCSRIETCCYSGVLMKVLARLGARAESVNMVMEVHDGQQENHDNRHQHDEHSRSA
jgi:hypothetical protein